MPVLRREHGTTSICCESKRCRWGEGIALDDAYDSLPDKLWYTFALLKGCRCRCSSITREDLEPAGVRGMRKVVSSEHACDGAGLWRVGAKLFALCNNLVAAEIVCTSVRLALWGCGDEIREMMPEGECFKAAAPSFSHAPSVSESPPVWHPTKVRCFFPHRGACGGGGSRR